MRPLQLGRAAFDPDMTPYALLEAAAAFYQVGEQDESERMSEFANDLATILTLPEAAKS